MNSGQRLLDALLQEAPSKPSANQVASLHTAVKRACSVRETEALRRMDAALDELLHSTDGLFPLFGYSFCGDNRSDSVCFANRFLWAPRGIPQKRRVGFVSSRLGHQLDELPEWFDALRTICSRIDRDREAVALTHKTAGFEFIRRAAYLFGVDRLEVHIAEKLSLENWLLGIGSLEFDDTDGECFPIWISPPDERLSSASVDQQAGAELRCDDRDSIHCHFCQTIHALMIRKNGQAKQAIEQRLSGADAGQVTILVNADPKLNSPELLSELQKQGAVLHFLIDKNSASATASRDDNCAVKQDLVTDASTGQSDSPHDFIQLDSPAKLPQGNWLTHCTRRRIGPWPDESPESFMDDLLFRRVGAQHDKLAALCRILRTGKLFATSDFVRGETAVVSFSANPLEQLLKQRTFRAHLARWDFEPYGISIQQGYLSALGTRPVIYGDETCFESLAENKKSLFQKIQPDRPHAESWRAENEWRHIGDLELQQIPADKVFAFVPTREEAAFVQTLTNIEVLVVGNLLNSQA
jgi:hypothetical protein